MRASWRSPGGIWVLASLAIAGWGVVSAAAHASLVVAPRARADIKIPLTIAASTDANPDATGRASPVVLRVYQLKGDASFRSADFFGLFDDEQKVLGPDLLGREEFVLAPAENRDITATISSDARFVGAVAAFRDIRNAQWRALVPGPIKGLTIAVERARLVLFPD